MPVQSEIREPRIPLIFHPAAHTRAACDESS